MSWLDLTRFHFVDPSVLWCLLIIPVLALLRERSTAGHPPWRSFGAMLGRGLALVALVLAAAGPFEETRRPDRSLAVVLDASLSVHPARRARAAAWLGDLEAQRGAVPTVFVSAGPRPELHADAAAALAVPSREAGAGTELRSAMELALARLAPARVQEIVLLTDGAMTRGDLEPSLRVASARDVAVHVVPLLDRTVALRVTDLVPAQDRLAGDVVDVEVAVHSNLAGDAQLILRARATERARAAVALLEGVAHATLQFRPEDAGVIDIEVRVELGATTVSAPARVRVRPRPAALVVGEVAAASTLRAALGGYTPSLSVTATPTLPAGPLDAWSLVVLLDPNLPALGSAGIHAVTSYVRDGGRLLVTGGANGLVTDEDVVAPLAAALPIKFPKRKKKQPGP